MPRKRKYLKRNGWIFWSLIAFVLLMISIFGLYWALVIRVEQGYFTADPLIIFLDHLFHGLLTATLIGWVVGSVIARTKKRKR